MVTACAAAAVLFLSDKGTSEPVQEPEPEPVQNVQVPVREEPAESEEPAQTEAHEQAPENTVIEQPTPAEGLKLPEPSKNRKSEPSPAQGDRTSFVQSGNRRTLTIKGVSFDMLLVNGGKFTMGATPELSSGSLQDESPAHEVTLGDFYIGKHEVTQALWEAVMGMNPAMNASGDNYPVEMVSWNECRQFVDELNRLTGKTFMLPTEAQWEYAARGGQNSRKHRYSGGNDINHVAWYELNAAGGTHKVGGKAPNELGLHDMTGNVAEWCSDFYDSYSSVSATDPQGPSSGSGHVVRGACYYSNADDCRISARSKSSAGYLNDNLGLRLVMKP